MNREFRKRMVGTTGALVLVCALAGVTSIAAFSFVDREGQRVREASEDLVLLNSLRQRILGLYTAGERVVVAQEGFDRFSEMQSAVAKARERLRSRTAGSFLTPDVAVVDRDADELRIAIQLLERAQPTDPRQALVNYRDTLRTSRDAFEADVDSAAQKVTAHQRDSLEHSSKVVKRARLAIVFIELLASCMIVSFAVMIAREIQRGGPARTPSEIASRAMLHGNPLTVVATEAKPEESQLLGRALGKGSRESQ